MVIVSRLTRLIFGAALVLLGMSGLFASETMAAPGPGYGKGGEQHICEIDRGVILQQRGSARCSADSDSYAKATGRRAEARATQGGRAVAEGVASKANADSNGIAKAFGEGSSATAHLGHATASGPSSTAQAVDLDSVASAAGSGSFASAVNGGWAKADGVRSHAHAGGTGSEARAIGTDSTADALGTNSYAEATGGGTATADGPGAVAIATGDCIAYATTGGPDSCTGA
jgi:hypothetical protein